jgi:hypothetical protein
MLDKLKLYRHESRKRREFSLQKKAEAPELYRIMLEGIQPLEWLLYEGRISHAAYILAYEWLEKGYLCRRLPPSNIMFEHQGYHLWLELTVKGRRVLERRHGGV